MNLELAKDNILRISSSFTKTQGEKLSKESFIKDLAGKSINGVYHIYGKVLNDNKSKAYSTHIKIDIKTDRIIDTKCTCETFEENRRQIRNYVCKHIVGTTYTFYNAAKKKIKSKNNSVEEKKVENKNSDDKILEKTKKDLESKRFLNLDIMIKCIKNDRIPSFKCEFRIGSGGTHLVVDIKDFIEKSNSKRTIKFNEGFTYNPIKDEFLDSDKDIIKFIKENKQRAKCKYITLYQNEIKDFFKLIDENKKITFNYDFINYEVRVKKSNVPVALTVRLKGNEFILKHHNKFPELLSTNGEAMFFDRNIYLPRKKQLNSYLPIYKSFLKNSEIKYEKSLESLNTLLENLKNITNEVVLDEYTSEYKKKLIKPKFYFYKEKDNIYCNVKLNYFGYIIDLIKDKSNRSFLRDDMKEKLIDMELERFKFIKNDKDFMFIGDDEDIYDLLSSGFLKLREIGIVKVSKELETLKLIDSSKIFSELNEFDNFYKLKYSFNDFTVKELGEAINSMKNGERFYKNKTSYLDLEDPGVAKFLNLIEDLGLDKISDNEIEIDKNKMLYLQEKLKDRNLSFIKGSKVLQDIVQKLLNKEYKRKLVPKKLNATLRNYQVAGFKWLNEITALGFGGILADDMGLGKTIQVIAFILSQKKTKTLIVMPTSVIYNWKDEFERFAPTLKLGLVHGSKASRGKVLDDYKKYDVILTTYGTLKNDEEKYNDLIFDYLIIDEAQNIKNHSAQATVSVKKIKSKCNIALTGTPIENNLMELWSIFDFVMPGYLFTKERFRERFVGNDDIGELKTLITPFILRRLKKDVLDELPDKVEKKYLVELNSKQKQIYKSYVKEVKMKIETSKDKVNLFAYLTKLRELCLDPSLVIPDYVGKSAKLNIVKELVEEASESRKKILLFSQFTSVLKKIEEDFKGNGVNYLYLDGSTSARDRVERVKEFNEDEDIKVFLISLKAGGVGLNLTSASLVIHFDPWWNPAIEDQATDRAHRFGQKNTVEVIKLVAKDTIEEKIVLMQEDKKELIQSLMDGKAMDGKGLKRLSEEEIIKLFD
ncbi:DEAD/DEAH box helicase [Clostridium sardiniense]|uniref:DEAD/DEAH box helicase n=1 Tax=Clostridium sardiniense TaxID=29369 RepID=A0ABS7KZY6_CLOSR|nr:DEAD/DEAH box helicase [Clostridium sardiniense]MDQ0459221.1 SNF2 family DNA or RNA helicase [Clostridium sardiniense]